MAKVVEEQGCRGVEPVVVDQQDRVAPPVSIASSINFLDAIPVAQLQPCRIRTPPAEKPVVVSQLSEHILAPGEPTSWIARFVRLPREMQIMILSYLSFGEMERLRRTCKFLRVYISKPMMRVIYPKIDLAILQTCRLCLISQLYGKDIVVSGQDHPQYPFSGNCVKCLVNRSELMVDTKYTLGCGADSFICRLCGLPVIITEEWDDRHFHVKCQASYLDQTVTFLFAGFLQAVFNVIATSLCWAFYNDRALILGCTTVSKHLVGDTRIYVLTIDKMVFVASVWAFLLFAHRKMLSTPKQMRTWHWSFLLEVVMLALWIVIVYAIANPMDGSPVEIRASTVATLIFIGVNLYVESPILHANLCFAYPTHSIIRFVNSVGFLVLTCELKYWRLHKPDPNRRRRFCTKFITYIFMLTYPEAICQPYPARWFRRPPLCFRWRGHGPSSLRRMSTQSREEVVEIVEAPDLDLEDQ